MADICRGPVYFPSRAYYVGNLNNPTGTMTRKAESRLPGKPRAREIGMDCPKIKGIS